MMKKLLNQNANYEQELIDSFEPNFSFHKNAINRFKSDENNTGNIDDDKISKLSELKKKINSIENCNLRKNSKNLIFGHGDINSPIMLIGEAPGEKEDETGEPFVGKAGVLLDKILYSIKLKRTSKGFKRRKAPGPDEIPMEFYKELSDEKQRHHKRNPH